ncbi:MAG: hypothetical protein IJ466_01425 [Clostridia bacterium]|nr:hypothetical protein [Clostridia bacterium]
MLDQALLKRDKAKASARKYWKAFFARSYIHIDEDHPGSNAWKIGRNYNLFCYMLALNEKGFWPTKFNGGLLTFDPSLGGKSPWSDDPLKYTQDFRLWGGGRES